MNRIKDVTLCTLFGGAIGAVAAVFFAGSIAVIWGAIRGRTFWDGIVQSLALLALLAGVGAAIGLIAGFVVSVREEQGQPKDQNRL